MSEQARIDERIGELHRLIAERLDADPERTMRAARDTLARFRGRLGERRALREWSEVLTAGPTEVRKILLDTSERAIWLRSTSPFLGIVPKAARDRVMSPGRPVRSRDIRDLA